MGECGEWWTTWRLWKENTKDVKDKNIQLTYIADEVWIHQLGKNECSDSFFLLCKCGFARKYNTAFLASSSTVA